MGCHKTELLLPPEEEIELGGTTIFPGDSTPAESYIAILTPQEVREGVDALAKYARPGSGVIDLHLMGCVSYESSFINGKRYETGVSFGVGIPGVPLNWSIPSPSNFFDLFPRHSDWEATHINTKPKRHRPTSKALAILVSLVRGPGMDDAVWNHAVFSKDRDRLLTSAVAQRSSVSEPWLEAPG
jgi:hypothetical protein